MRRPLVLLLILIAAPAQAEPKLTPKVCADMAGSMVSLTLTTRKTADQVGSVSYRPLIAVAEGTAKEAAERADKARQKVVEAMRAYGDATDGLADQMRACAK